VLAIVTAANAGKLGKGQYNAAPLLGGPEVQHYHQAMALVVAETFEQAAPPRNGQGRLRRGRRVRSGQRARPGCRRRRVARRHPRRFRHAFAAAPVQLDQTYTTPINPTR
jgi:xanthine dehydrogenase YagR molybdenum-binding subunit